MIEGNRGKRATSKQEPDPEYLQDLTPPPWLDAKAADVWAEVAPHLARAKLLTHVDVVPLAMGCVAIAQYRLAVGRIGDDLVRAKRVEGDMGGIVEVGEHVNPWMMVQSMSYKQAMGVFAQFGMTPAARTRIAVNPQGDLFENGGKGSKTAGYFA